MVNFAKLALPTIFTAVVRAAEGFFDYIDTSTWPDVCLDSTDPQKPQQSPIDIPMTGIQSAVDVVFTKLVEGQITLYQDLVEAADGNLSMILSSTIDSPASLMYNNVEYHYNHIHSHWGSSEHLVDGVGTHGNFHIVFKSTSGQAAVIEVMVNFVDVISDGVVVDFPRCPTVGPKEGARLGASCPMDMPKVTRSDAWYSKNLKNTERTANMNLLQAMGWPSADFGKVVHYQGSLTTPPCSGPVQHFVQTEPVRIHDPEGDWCGCDSFRDAFPHGDSADVPGNYRPPQMIKDVTTFDEGKVNWPRSSAKKRAILPLSFIAAALSFL